MNSLPRLLLQQVLALLEIELLLLGAWVDHLAQTSQLFMLSDLLFHLVYHVGQVLEVWLDLRLLLQ